MIKYLTFAFLFIALSACAAERPPEVIRNDRGGNILEYINKRDRINRPTIIAGTCSSACTILTTHPQVCLRPNSVIRFHRPSVPGGVDAIENRWIKIMAGYFSGPAKHRWVNNWSKSDEFTNIPAREFVRLEQRARLCSG